MPTTTQLTKAPPTRERRLYIACARIYANLFRAVFAAPLAARRYFRVQAESGGADAALDTLWQRPDLFSEQRVPAVHAHDPAFVYWTYRSRRPRLLLKRAAAAIARELSRREHMRRVEQARERERHARDTYGDLYTKRERGRTAARDVVYAATPVYVERTKALRAILRATRTQGAGAVLRVLQATPEQFGALRVNRLPRFRDTPVLRDWKWLDGIQQDTHERALSFLPRLVDVYRAAANVRPARRAVKAGRTRKAREVMEAARRRVREVEAANTALAGGLKEAAQAIAVLLRRRATDEQPTGDSGPPPIVKQLAAMLPDGAAELIAEADKLAKDESGDEHEGWRRDLSISRGGVEVKRGGGWRRDDRNRSRGLSR